MYVLETMFDIKLCCMEGVTILCFSQHENTMLDESQMRGPGPCGPPRLCEGDPWQTSCLGAGRV